MAYSLGADGTLAVALFGLPDECLSIAHDAGGSPTPHVAGPARGPKAGRLRLTRGLDALLLDLD